MITGQLTDNKNKKLDIIQTVFENLEVSNFALANSAAMALYSVGKTNGLVVKSGEAFTQAIPVFEGNVMAHAKKSVEFGGRNLSEEFHRLLL